MISAWIPLAGAAALALVSGADGAAETPDFGAEVRPILERHCYACHGPGERQGGLGMLSHASAMFGGDSTRPLYVPGDPDASLIIERVTAENPELRMPPTGRGLPEEDIGVLRRWIAAGGHWPGSETAPEADIAGADHWAFQAPAQPAPPQPEDARGPRNPIDAFVRARLESEGLEPAPEAAPHTLARRLYLDLIGLPPTPAQVRRFVEDGGPRAYERLVEELLASPHYGERQAIAWLDAARYADTNGYEKDRHREIWPYRDWVIGALNDDMPYDQFVIEQIAGDLLPNATPSQHIATGFLRNSMFNEEGGIDAEEFRYEAVVDRANTAGTVMLGLTMACAQCHTHKYDPVTQREYFSFLAFLDNTDDVYYSIPDDEIAARRQAIEAEIEAAILGLPGRFPADEIRRERFPLLPLDPRATGPLDLERSEDGALRALGRPGQGTSIYSAEFALGAREFTGVELELTGDAEAGFRITGIHGELAMPGGEVVPLDFQRAESGLPHQRDPGASHAIDADPDTFWAGPAEGPAVIALSLASPILPDRFARLRLQVQQKHDGGAVLREYRVNALRDRVEPSHLPESQRREAHLARKFDAWLAETAPRAVPWTPLNPIAWESENLATLERLPDRSLRASGNRPNTDTYEITFFTEAEDITALRLEALPDPSLPGGGPGRGTIMSEGDFLLSNITVAAAPWNAAPDALEPVPIAAASHSYAAEDRDSALALDGKLDTGWGIKGREGEAHAAVFNLEGPIGHPGGSRIVVRLDQYYVHEHTLGRFRISAASAKNAAASGLPANIEAILARAESEWTGDEREALLQHFLLQTPELADEHARIAGLRAQMPEYQTTLAVAERAEPRETRLRHRGEFLEPRAAVPPGVPAVLHPLPETGPKNRMLFARWLAAPENPLLARVAVNRVWSNFFGQGLVATPEDFGLRGAPPSHPELLDWLAVEFQRRGWSQKELVRLIVNSATYRQAAETAPEIRERDPVNQLLTRGPRQRVPAEIVRDIALAASGLLEPAVGGPSVRPPLPEGLGALTFGGLQWPVSEGPDRYRRGVYTYIQRTLPYPGFALFDAPARDVACVARMRSNTPMQALAQLNDTVVIDAARAMARRVLAEPGQTVEQRIRHAFYLTLSRPPDPQETEWVRRFYVRQLARFQWSELDAREVLGMEPRTGGRDDELHLQAAWTLVCRALLNLDEALSSP